MITPKEKFKRYLLSKGRIVRTESFDIIWEYIEKEYENISSQLGPVVSQATCGFCKDCKNWDTENVECTKDIIWIVNKECYLKINDLKTQNYFGCTQFESKLSG